MAGNEFLDYIRNDTIWEKVKSKAKEKLSSVSFQVLASLAEDFAKNSIFKNMLHFGPYK